METKNKITFNSLEEKDKKDIYLLFHPTEGMTVEKSAYQMHGLESLTEDELFKRMVDFNVEKMVRNESQFIGIIETAPYEEDALEVRTAAFIDESIGIAETERTTQEYIISALRKYGAKRIILEVSKDNNFVIKHLLSAGYKVISTINNTITFEFDFSKFNKR